MDFLEQLFEALLVFLVIPLYLDLDLFVGATPVASLLPVQGLQVQLFLFDRHAYGGEGFHFFLIDNFGLGLQVARVEPLGGLGARDGGGFLLDNDRLLNHELVPTYVCLASLLSDFHRAVAENVLVGAGSFLAGQLVLDGAHFLLETAFHSNWSV